MPIGAMACAEWLNMIKDSESGLQERLVEIYGDDAAILEDRKMIFLRALEGFAAQFGGDREVVISRAPGRINLLGHHIITEDYTMTEKTKKKNKTKRNKKHFSSY